jgi:hypothetical protein
VRGLVRYGNETFLEDKKTYIWMKERRCEVLELTKPFMATILNTTFTKNSRVVPKDYEQPIEMVVCSNSLNEFIVLCNAAESVWKDVESLDRIHEEQIEKELMWLEKFADRGINIAQAFAMLFGTSGCRPSPALVACKFSAFIEYLESSFRKVSVSGAKPRKNDRGMYVDWQLLTYLACPDVMFVTHERFSGEITKSPQKDRIIKPDELA